MSETATAKLFKHGRGQVVRRPKEFRMPGKEVRVRRFGRGALLVTANDREFARVPGLKTEDRPGGST